MAVRIRKTCKAAVLSNRSHSFVLMNSTQSSMVGIPARPPGRVHFSAAAAEALLAPPEFTVNRFQRYGYAGRKPVDGGHKTFAVGFTGRFESEH